MKLVKWEIVDLVPWAWKKQGEEWENERTWKRRWATLEREQYPVWEVESLREVRLNRTKVKSEERMSRWIVEGLKQRGPVLVAFLLLEPLWRRTKRRTKKKKKKIHLITREERWIE